MAIPASQFEGLYVCSFGLDCRLAAQNQLDICQLEFLRDPFPAEGDKPIEIAETSHFIYGAHQALYAFNFALCRLLQKSPHESLQRLKKQNRHEQKNRRGRFGRKM